MLPGLANNTIVVLWGDHGFHLGDLGIWTKHTNYEQANRIPILIAAPGVTQPGSVTKQLAESVDIFPTLVDLAGVPMPKPSQPMDGVSLVPVLKDSTVRVRDHAFHAYPKAKLGRRYGQSVIGWSSGGPLVVRLSLLSTSCMITRKILWNGKLGLKEDGSGSFAESNSGEVSATCLRQKVIKWESGWL